MTVNREFDVALCGYFGFGNLGDELLARASIESLKACGIPADRIALFSASPDESARAFGVRSFDRWSLGTLFDVMARSKSLLLAGGGLFQDASSARSCAYYWGVVRAARWRGCKVWALGQSVGPLVGKFSRTLTKDALSSCAYLAVRDAPSLQMLGGMGLGAATMPDLVWSLDLPDIPVGKDGPVLVNLRPSRNEEAGKSMAQFARLCASKGIALKGIALAEEDRVEMLRLQASGDLPVFSVETARSAGDFLRLARDGCVAAGMRLHFGILSAMCGLKVFMAAYDPKVAGFAKEYGVNLLIDADLREDFDIIERLAKTAFQDKRKKQAFRSEVFTFFKEGLDIVLGGQRA